MAYTHDSYANEFEDSRTAFFTNETVLSNFYQPTM